MEKQRMFRIMANMNHKNLNDFSKRITEEGDAVIIKEPSKTLVMIQMREPVENSLFYIGEVMVTEAIVEMNGIKGMAVTMGDDFKKVLAMAIIDCGFNNGLPVMKQIEKDLMVLETKQKKYQEKENGMHLKTMVNFNTMAGGEVQ